MNQPRSHEEHKEKIVIFAAFVDCFQVRLEICGVCQQAGSEIVAIQKSR
ncbi:MAG: hypothetical protein SF029_01135 [bacterium]|nr:hypothetical protein [bacterium]